MLPVCIPNVPLLGNLRGASRLARLGGFWRPAPRPPRRLGQPCSPSPSLPLPPLILRPPSRGVVRALRLACRAARTARRLGLAVDSDWRSTRTAGRRRRFHRFPSSLRAAPGGAARRLRLPRAVGKLPALLVKMPALLVKMPALLVKLPALLVKLPALLVKLTALLVQLLALLVKQKRGPALLIKLPALLIRGQALQGQTETAPAQPWAI